MRQIETANWRRISKAKAKRLYMTGKGTLLIVPHKIDPENRWGMEVVKPYPPINNQCESSTEEEWEKFLNEYCWYNCQHNECGKYPAFYERKYNG